MADLQPLKLKNSKPKKRFKVFYKYLAVFIFLGVVALFGLAKTSAPAAWEYVLGPKTSLKTENNHLNILLLGMAGGKHDGATLTDTIIVASYNIATNHVDLISIPRDLWVDQYKVKVNALYQKGLFEGEGLDVVKREIGNLLGISIPYSLRIDFSGFTKAIDLVGGINVDVKTSFDDYSYPVPGKENDLCGYSEKEMDLNEEEAKKLGIPQGKQKVLIGADNNIATASAKLEEGILYSDQQVFNLFRCRFEHLTFKQGLITMDGETALKFVRSRHGTGSEGSDFARSKRQQQVLQAFKDKALSLETLADPKKTVGLMQTFGSSVETDISQVDYFEFFKLVKKIESVKSYVIDGNGKDPLLISPPSGLYGAWVLIPPGNDFSKIKKYVSNIFSDTLESSTSAIKDLDKR